jgi:hypothetical protein
VSAEALNPRDVCPEGGEHDPEVEVDEFPSEFWGAIQITKKVTVACSKCGQPCRPRRDEEQNYAFSTQER